MEGTEAAIKDTSRLPHDPYKLHGSEEVSSYVLKNCEDTIDRPLQILFNMSLEENVVPIKWKRANVVFIYYCDELQTGLSDGRGR